MTMRSHLTGSGGRRTPAPGPRRGARPYRRRDVPRVPPARSPRPPEGTALSLLRALAEALETEGVVIRGAFARAGGRAMAPPFVQPEEVTNDAVYDARFEIPTTANDGTPFPASVLVALLRDLYKRTGGATVIDALGVWRDGPKAACFDVSLTVEVCTSDREGLVAFLERVRRDLDQDAIALRITRPEFVWIERGEGSP